MKILILITMLISSAATAKPNLEKIWEVGGGQLHMPESAFFDAGSGFIFVSNIGVSPTGKEGKGFISKLDTDGKVIEQYWVKNLNAPKGIRVYMGKLWVADIDTLIGINVADGKIMEKISIPGAGLLNDVAIDSDGAIYVSDTFASKIFRIREGKAEVFLEGKKLESPNGLLLINGKFFVATWGLTKDFSTKEKGHFYQIDLKSKKMTKMNNSPSGNLDGIEKASNGKFIISDWVAGKVWLGKQLLIEGLKGSADIGYVYRRESKDDLLLVPEMLLGKLTAYKIKN